MVKIAIVVYSTWGHIIKLAEAELAGLKAIEGIEAEIVQIPETLPEDILTSIHAAAKPDYPVINAHDLVKYDGFLFGLPTRYGTFPSQFKAFWDATGSLWASGGLAGKYVGMFVSTASSGGGQEVTVRNSLSNFVHHGMIYVPLGYKSAFAQLTNLEEVHGGSPWGAGTFAAGDGSRQPSKLELDVAEIQGKTFGETVFAAFGPKKEKTSAAPTTTTAVAGEGATKEAATKETATTASQAPAADRTTQSQAAPAESKSSKCFGCVIM